MKKLYHLFLTFALLSAAGCNDFLDPDDDNSYKGDELLTYIQRAEGVLLNAYASVPNANQISVMTDVATDNAVWNTSSGNAFRNIVSGEWSSTNNPFDKWSSAYTAIGYCNLFLDELVDRVEWSYSDAWLCEAFRERLTAEARGLRAYYYMELLTAHSGVGVNTGRLLGVPMIMHPIDVEEGDLDFPRDTYERCVALVLEDLQFAIDHLPYEYKNNSEKPEEDRVYGARFANRLCGRIAMALKARLLLQAASPAFNPDNDAAKWEAAAVAAAELIDASGGIDAIDKSRIKFWRDDTSREIVWRKDYYTGRDWETTCFPPSLLGNGRMNPTQDFADAFPYRNGVPYVPGNPSDPDDPYAGRDPRLDEYLIRNGSLFKDNVINTVDGDVDGIDRKPSSSTTTGYYMKKLMIFSEVFLIACCAVVYVLARPITMIGGMEAKSAEMCLDMMFWITIVKPIVWMFAFIPAYGMRAAGDVKFSMITSCITMWTFRFCLCVYLIRVCGMGPMAVWIGMFTDWTVRAIVFGLRFKSGKWMEHKVV